MNKKRVSIWDDEEELPVQYAGDDIDPPWSDLFLGGAAIALILFVGFLIGRWTA